jgi:tRNA(fMet)-specific endonuclease VapC
VEGNLQLLRRFFEPLVSLSFDDRCAEEAGLIRLDLERTGRPIGPNDLLIAATARANDCVLVTHNLREFGRIPGLRLDDWEEPLGGR